MSLSELNRIGTILKQALAMPTVNDLGRVTGQARRLRTVTPHRLFLAVVSALGARRVETLADLLRVFTISRASAWPTRRSTTAWLAPVLKPSCGRCVDD